MNHRQRILLITLMTALALFVYADVNAQEAESTETAVLDIADNFYNNAAGWHVLIPDGWENLSTAEYARFTRDANEIFVTDPAGATVDEAIRAAIQAARPNFAADTTSKTSINLVNGTWSQFLYVTDSERITAHAQQYEGGNYVVLFISETGIQPIIIGSDALDTAVTQAAQLYDSSLTQPVTSDQSEGLQPVRVNTYMNANGDTVTALGRVVSSSTVVMVGTVERDALVNASAYFTVLNDFFLTPDTAPYLWLGVALAFAILAVLVISMFLRYQNLKRDAAALDTLLKEDA